MPISRFIWSDSGSGLSERAWELAERTGAAWVGNNANAHMSLMRSTVRDELAVAMEQRGVPREQMAPAVDAAVEQWGLQAEQDPVTLSTGQTRRVAIATALLAGPDRLVLDCPCDGLDADSVRHLLTVLDRFDGDVVVFDRTHNALADRAEVCEHVDGRQCLPPRLEQGIQPREPSAAPLVFEAKDVRIQRGTSMLGPWNITAQQGGITHVAGPNGSGKTSLFLAALGLVPYEGSITDTTFGWCPTDMDSAITRKSVREELSVGVGEERAQQMLDFAELADVAEEHPLDLPSARRRLLLVAAAMVRQPQVVLLDEPTVGLDGPGAAQLVRLMRRYVADGSAIVWTCHDPAFAAIV